MPGALPRPRAPRARGASSGWSPSSRRSTSPTPPLPEHADRRRRPPRSSPSARGSSSSTSRRTGHGRAGLTTLVLRSLKQARYDPQQPRPRRAALAHYCHFTSPIRRYPDLVCHRALLCAVGGGRGRAARASRMAEAGEWTSARERDAMVIERDADDVARCFLLERELFERGWDTRLRRGGDGRDRRRRVRRLRRRLRGDAARAQAARRMVGAQRGGHDPARNAQRRRDPPRRPCARQSSSASRPRAGASISSPHRYDACTFPSLVNRRSFLHSAGAGAFVCALGGAGPKTRADVAQADAAARALKRPRAIATDPVDALSFDTPAAAARRPGARVLGRRRESRRLGHRADRPRRVDEPCRSRGKRTFRALVYQLMRRASPTPPGPAQMPGPTLSGRGRRHARRALPQRATSSFGQAITMHPHGVRYNAGLRRRLPGRASRAPAASSRPARSSPTCGRHARLGRRLALPRPRPEPHAEHAPRPVRRDDRPREGRQGARRRAGAVPAPAAAADHRRCGARSSAINGRAFAGNTPTIRAKVGQDVAIHVIGGDANFHTSTSTGIAGRTRRAFVDSPTVGPNETITARWTRGQPRTLAVPLPCLLAPGRRDGRLVPRRTLRKEEVWSRIRLIAAAAAARARRPRRWRSTYPPPADPGDVQKKPAGKHATLHVCREEGPRVLSRRSRTRSTPRKAGDTIKVAARHLQGRRQDQGPARSATSS